MTLPAPHYVVFVADPNVDTGVSWCPDTERTINAVRQTLADKKASLLEVLVGPRVVWKDAHHPFKYVSSLGLRV